MMLHETKKLTVATNPKTCLTKPSKKVKWYSSRRDLSLRLQQDFVLNALKALGREMTGKMSSGACNSKPANCSSVLRSNAIMQESPCLRLSYTVRKTSAPCPGSVNSSAKTKQLDKLNSKLSSSFTLPRFTPSLFDQVHRGFLKA
jgi:hypothetical protein